MKNLFLTFGLVMALFQVKANGFTDSVSVGLPTSNGLVSFVFKLSQPSSPSVGVYQAIMLFATPSGKNNQLHSDLKSQAALSFSSTNKVALVLVKTALDTSFALLSQALLSDSVQAGLTKLANRANRPELIHAPLLPVGFARASRLAPAIALAMPAKTAGFISARAYRLSGFSGGALANIPHLVLSGEVSGPDVRNNAGVYFSAQLRDEVLARRSAGELIAHAVEMNASQSTLKMKTWVYIFSFLQKVMEKRIPLGSNPVAGPVALNALVVSSGYLGRSTSWDSFVAGNYSISPFSGPLVPAQSFWFLDQNQAETWRNFQVTVFDSASISPIPLPVVPWCTGQRPSSLNAKISMNASVNLNPGNFFRIEVSDITGNFDNPIYQARFFGTTASAFRVDSVKDGLFPDNFNFMTSVPDANVKRYRIRVVSTDPYFESPNSGEITLINFCGPGGGQPRVYLSTARPFKSTYNPGDSIAVMLYKNPLSTWTAGDGIRIELSNKDGSFNSGTNVLTNFTPPFNSSATLDSVLVRIKIPDTLSFGNKYRLKPYISNIPINQGRQTAGNGHDITVVPNQSGNQIVINTKAISDTAQTSANSGGNILFDGGSPITARGVCWSNSPGPTITLSTKTSDGSGSGSYTSNVTGLSPGTQYFLRSYASNANGTQYGNELTFRTKLGNQVPILSTGPVTDINQTTANSGGNITFDGNSPVVGRGVCWGTNPNPSLWATGVDSTGDGIGIGTYSSNLSNLTAATTYYVRAYARNAFGLGYGNEIQFTTASAPVNLASVQTLQVLYTAGSDSATGRGNITFDGGAAITARGVVWGTTPLPTIGAANNAPGGQGTGNFSTRFGILQPATTYFVRAYATNAAGTSYGDESSFVTVVSVKRSRKSHLIQAYPNPAHDFLFVKSDYPLAANQVWVEALNGKKIGLAIFQKDDKTFEVQTKNLSGGMYLLRFNVDGHLQTLRFFK
jgi:hypothetical protein